MPLRKSIQRLLDKGFTITYPVPNTKQGLSINALDADKTVVTEGGAFVKELDSKKDAIRLFLDLRKSARNSAKQPEGEFDKTAGAAKQQEEAVAAKKTVKMKKK